MAGVGMLSGGHSKCFRVFVGDENDPVPHRFDFSKSIKENVADVCIGMDIKNDTGENYYVLMRCKDNVYQLIRSVSELRQLGDKEVLKLCRAADVVDDHLWKFRRACVASPVDFRDHLLAAVSLIHGDQRMAEEMIEKGGIGVVCSAVVAVTGADASATIELAMRTMCELLQHRKAKGWIEENEFNGVVHKLFAKIFPLLFPSSEAAEVGIRDDYPRACLAVLVFLLFSFPEFAQIAHDVAKSVPRDDTESESFYRRLMSCIDADSSDFFSNCALGFLSVLVTVSEGDAKLLESIRAEIIDLVGSADGNELFRQCTCADYLMDQVIACNLATIAGCAHGVESGGSENQTAKIDTLERKNKMLTEGLRRMQEEVRKKQRTLNYIVRYVKVESSDLVDQSLEAIVKTGWDSINWSKNYTLFHYVAERVQDPGVAELVGLLATNLESKDDKGKRPIDYAREAGHKGVIQVIERLRRDEYMRQRTHTEERGRRLDAESSLGRQRSSREKDAASVPSQSGDELQKMYAALEGVSPELRRSIEKVLDTGWSNIDWPRGFSAMHLAASQGHSGAIQLLSAAGANPGEMDDFQFKPLEYAVQNEHTQVVPLLQKCMHEWEKRSSVSKHSKSQLPAAPPATNRLRPLFSDPVWRKNAPTRLEELRPELQKACGVVLEKGWSKVKWPHGFSALHLCAKLGALDATQLLLEATAEPGLALSDDQGMKPIDYASSKGRHDVVELLTAWQASSTAGEVADDAKLLGQPARTSPQTVSGNLDSPVPGEMNLLKGILNKWAPAAGGTVASKLHRAVKKIQSDVDIFQARLKMREKDEAEMGVADLRAEVKRLKAALGAVRGGGRMSSHGSNQGVNEFMGPLDADNLAKYMKAVENFGREAVLIKLTEPVIAGGMALTDDEALQALAQMATVRRLVETFGPSFQKSSDGKGKGTGPPPSDRASDGKGKGPKGLSKGPSKGPAKGGKEGKGKASTAESCLTKPEIQPKKKMKPLWWCRLIKGHQLKEQTVWDAVKDLSGLLPVDNLEERFARNVATTEKLKPVKTKETKKQVKLLRIITDPNAVVCREAVLKQLPPAQEVARALIELDDTVLEIDQLQVVQHSACPSPGELQLLVEARKTMPNVPMALPEQYMWVIGALPGYQQRVDCWAFVRTYSDRKDAYKDALAEFLEIVTCFRRSEVLPIFLGIVLAVGNHLNGGTSRGRADGFDILTLGKLEEIKDSDGKDIRYFILNVFFNLLQESAERFFRELAPVFANVGRLLGKSSDGGDRVGKSARIALEDFDVCAKALINEMTEKQEMMQRILQYVDDPADQFKVRMPEEFARAQQDIGELRRLNDQAKEEYRKLLSWFHIEGMESCDFFLLWDNLFLPGDLIARNGALAPDFCRSAPISFAKLRILWGFQEVETARLPRKTRTLRKKLTMTCGKTRNSGKGGEGTRGGKM
eukprot:TRINITY_DN31019_c0_g1_i1.p1 TRINITY_DN31019_c0_g1~~TRINITY_DN31019_c0_g1_i1.p1  ORF type:complete len:1445 (-),score=265.07 TRINITY_DN31019_c0_g1_i1:120-4454(-)